MIKTQAMSKTSKNTSLRVITGAFLFFLFLIGFIKFDEAYIQLKHSVVDEHIHAVFFLFAGIGSPYLYCLWRL